MILTINRKKLDPVQPSVVHDTAAVAKVFSAGLVELWANISFQFTLWIQPRVTPSHWYALGKRDVSAHLCVSSLRRKVWSKRYECTCKSVQVWRRERGNLSRSRQHSEHLIMRNTQKCAVGDTVRFADRSLAANTDSINILEKYHQNIYSFIWLLAGCFKITEIQTTLKHTI